MNRVQILKLVSLALGGAGMLLANHLQTKETEELIEKALTEREAKHRVLEGLQ